MCVVTHAKLFHMADQYSSLSKQIERVKAEIVVMKADLDAKTAFLSGLEEAYRLVTKVKTSFGPPSSPSTNDGKPREGTDLARSLALIEAAGRPMRIEELLSGLGKENTKQNRVSLVGSLGMYVREGKWFNRPAPNTFGLIGMSMPTDEQASLLV
jgi:hypothetical protein